MRPNRIFIQIQKGEIVQVLTNAEVCIVVQDLDTGEFIAPKTRIDERPEVVNATWKKALEEVGLYAIE